MIGALDLLPKARRCTQASGGVGEEPESRQELLCAVWAHKVQPLRLSGHPLHLPLCGPVSPRLVWVVHFTAPWSGQSEEHP